MIPGDLKKSILQPGRLIEVVSKYVRLQKKGAEHVGLCPFHNERTPSFSLHDKKGIFKCFGCGESGDVIDFIRKKESLPFLEAMAFIANIENLDFTEIATEPAKKRNSDDRKKAMKFVDKVLVARSLQAYDTNDLAVYLSIIIPKDAVLSAFVRYFVGTAKDGSAIFWQVDRDYRIRTGQKISYNRETGRRIKEIAPKRLFTQKNDFFPCLFGEHLISDYVAGRDQVCIVESEKTALICSIYLPELGGKKCIWIASVGNNGLTAEKIEALKGLHVVLCPDFSFISRATWGAEPMRRDAERKMNPEGEIDPDYISRAILLQRIGAGVTFFDPFPHLMDNSDIADHLLQSKPDTL